MILGWVSAHREDDVGVLDVDPPVGHRPAPERGGQTGHRGTVSYPGLAVPVRYPESRDELPLQVIELVRVGTAADHRHSRVTVHDLALRVLLDEALVAGCLDVLRDLRDRVVPGDGLPLVGTLPADLGAREAIGVVDVFPESRALGAERAAVDRVVGIALHVDDRGRGVLGLVAERVDDHAARDRAVRTRASGLRRARDFELAHLRPRLVEIEAERDRSAGGSGFHERSSSCLLYT